MTKFEDMGVKIPQILFPRKGVDLSNWAVVACDQFTSQPEYWEELYRIVGDDPSTLHLVLPEVYLESADVEKRIQHVHQTMADYLQNDLFEKIEGFVYVERVIGDRVRKGLMVVLDLEKYDYRAGSNSIIRATEATIVERIPPRLRIRDGAALEVPHILILIDDEKREIIEPLGENIEQLEVLYHSHLLMGGGEIHGYVIKQESLELKVLQGLERLADKQYFQDRYQLPPSYEMLVFAVGDGNHSMATAKTYWEQIKGSVPNNHAARYALVELVNLYDEGLQFEPIHRLTMGVKVDLLAKIKQFYPHNTYEECVDAVEMKSKVNEINCDEKRSAHHRIGVIVDGKLGIITIEQPSSNLAVTSIQSFIDIGIKEKWFEKVDYIHGDEVIVALATKPNQVGFFLPPIDKKLLFKTVIVDGNLPKKAFSMGHAHEKRYYMECRSIR